MKTASIFYFFILFASAILPVLGNPVPNCNVGEGCIDIVQRDDADIAALQPSATATIEYIKTHDVNKKALLFYSGSTETKIKGKTQKVPAFKKIGQFKKDIHDVQILADIVREAKQNSQSWKDAEWNAVSEALAQHAKSPVFVLLGKDVQPNSVYIKSELPALTANANVKKPLDIYEIETDGSIKKK